MVYPIERTDSEFQFTLGQMANHCGFTESHDHSVKMVCGFG